METCERKKRIRGCHEETRRIVVAAFGHWVQEWIEDAEESSSLMSVWSTSTGRNSVFGGENGTGHPSSHLPIHVNVAHLHTRNANEHCFHKRFYDFQHPHWFFYPTRDFWQVPRTGVDNDFRRRCRSQVMAFIRRVTSHGENCS